MDLSKVASIITLCFPGIELNVIEDILLSMKSNHMFDKVVPGEIIILYKEDESYVYARNDGNGLIIERAFVPDTQVNRTHNPHYDLGDSLDELHEEILNKRAKKIGSMLRVDKESDFFKVVIESSNE